jgi:adenine-specific DNA-methyltransferase
VLQYLLEHETDGSPSLLAEEAFTHPFDYTLQIEQSGESPEAKTVDLVETFHYLIGMTVQEYTATEHQGRRYVSTRGTVETSTGIDEVRCIWRDTEEPDALDLEEEATWAKKNLLSETPADRIYVNGTTQIPGAQPVEIPFRDRMG